MEGSPGRGMISESESVSISRRQSTAASLKSGTGAGDERSVRHMIGQDEVVPLLHSSSFGVWENSGELGKRGSSCVMIQWESERGMSERIVL